MGPDRAASGDGVRPLCFAFPKGEVHPGSFVDGDHEVIRRDLGFRGDPSVDVLQERQPGRRRPTFYEGYSKAKSRQLPWPSRSVSNGSWIPFASRRR